MYFTSTEGLVSLWGTFGFVVDHACKVLNAELGLVTVLRGDVVCVEFVLGVEFVQHGGISSLKKNPHKQQELTHLRHTAVPKSHLCKTQNIWTKHEAWGVFIYHTSTHANLITGNPSCALLIPTTTLGKLSTDINNHHGALKHIHEYFPYCNLNLQYDEMVCKVKFVLLIKVSIIHSHKQFMSVKPR